MNRHKVQQSGVWDLNGSWERQPGVKVHRVNSGLLPAHQPYSLEWCAELLWHPTLHLQKGSNSNTWWVCWKSEMSWLEVVGRLWETESSAGHEERLLPLGLRASETDMAPASGSSHPTFLLFSLLLLMFLAGDFRRRMKRFFHLWNCSQHSYSLASGKP